jgi:hypothetical protein
MIHAWLRRLVAFTSRSLVVCPLAACGPGQGSTAGEATEGDASTTAATATTAASATSAATAMTEPAVSSTSSMTAADDTSTTADGPSEYVGHWTTGFGIAYFTPCGENEAWYASGLPGYEVCDPDPFWLRVIGVELPPSEGDATRRIEVLEILEGPCTGGSCDGSVPVGECDGFAELCGIWTLVECDLLAQDCPRGLKCMPWANDGGAALNSTHCTPLAPAPGQPGDPCTVEGQLSGFDDCALGAVCWDVDPATLQGVCAALCDQALMPDPACTMGTSCTSIFAAADPAGVCL